MYLLKDEIYNHDEMSRINGDNNSDIYASNSHQVVGSWFLGPQAENHDYFQRFLNAILEEHRKSRQSYYPEDGKFITLEMQNSVAFGNSMHKLTKNLIDLSNLLRKHSIPFWSPRYSAHMCMEASMPATLGYIMTMLYNPNNVSTEGGPITTWIEVQAGLQLCAMLGYSIRPVMGEPVGWGHITSGGTIANLESIWAARNLKFYPLSLRNSMAKNAPLAFISSRFKVQTCAGEEKLFKDLTLWELLNLKVSTILEIPERLENEYAISPTFLENVMGKYLIQSVGKEALEKKWGIEQPIQYMVSNTKHYSWPKCGAITGIGSENIVNVPVDNAARMDADSLEKILEERLHRQQAVYAVVAIIGSTEEGAVDPLDRILALRESFQARGMSFVVHADAAWGGYFASMIQPAKFREAPSNFVPILYLPKNTEDQLSRLKDADSITIDPHKSGYIPYPAGGLCYRDERMRFLVTWTSPYISRDCSSESIGVYGVEGSKSGAAAVSTWLSNKVIGLNERGYGALLGEASFTCSRLSAHWASMSTKDTSFIVVPFNMLPSELLPDTSEQKVEAERQYIRDNILNKDNWDLAHDEPAMDLLRKIGSDLTINIFACNFRLSDGTVNKDVEEANYLNKRIVERLSVASLETDPADIPFFLTSTELAQDQYGACATNFKRRLGLEGDMDLFVLRNVVMSPFPTDGNFVKKLMDIFQSVVEEEVEVCRERNSIKPDIHNFIMQGTDKLYLVYQPMFYSANHRQQLIITGDLPVKTMQQYVAARKEYPDTTFTLATQCKEDLSTVLETGSFTAVINKADGTNLFKNIPLTNITILKQHPLNSPHRDANYPTNHMPFYLYGTPNQAHIDHMLLLAPNGQFSADQITLSLNHALPKGELERGAIVHAKGVYESSMQPFPQIPDLAQKQAFFFRRGKEFEIAVYKDLKEAVAEGPGLADVTDSELIATGTMRLTGNVFVESVVLNADPVVRGRRSGRSKEPVVEQESWKEEMESIFWGRN